RRGGQVVRRSLPAAAVQPRIRASRARARRADRAGRGGRGRGDLSAGRPGRGRREAPRDAVPSVDAVLPVARRPRHAAAADQVVHAFREADPADTGGGGGAMATWTTRG